MQLSLMRFEYDMATGTKKKLSDNIFIPETLDFSAFVDDGEEIAYFEKTRSPFLC